MNRQYYIDLANNGLKMPIGADLMLREKPDHEARLLDGKGLGEVVVETARRFNTPLVFPLMDLTLEKEWMLTILGIAAHDVHTHHFSACPTQETIAQLQAGLRQAPTPRIRATCDAIRHVAETTSLVPVGMSIGPFSLMTKLLSDPITGVYVAGTGVTAEDDEEVRTIETILEMGIQVILRNIELQVKAGAKAICICEPAANLVYISPNQIQDGSDIFERYVLAFNRRIKQHLDDLGCDLIFHDCGELLDMMVEKFGQLDPAIMSLGSSRKLWDDARLISKRTVLFGNLPTKRFYSDKDVSLEMVDTLSHELLTKMAAVGHPFILGSECDVLSVPESKDTILRKVDRMLGCCTCCTHKGESAVHSSTRSIHPASTPAKERELEEVCA